MTARPGNTILIVAQDEALRTALVETVEGTGEYVVSQASNFDEALSQVLNAQLALVITENELPDLSGIDLLAVIGSVRPDVPVIVIDDDLSAKSALAAFRLGAIDYLSKPINLSLMLIQIARALEQARNRATVLSASTSPPERPRPEQEYRLSPRVRAAALALKHSHFKSIALQLSQLRLQTGASFAGLLDGEGNIIGAAGTLENYDLMLLKRAITIDHSATQALAGLLEEDYFRSYYLEGERSRVYIIEFGQPYRATLAVICPTDSKPGVVWLYVKRTAEAIREILPPVKATQPALPFMG